MTPPVSAAIRRTLLLLYPLLLLIPALPLLSGAPIFGDDHSSHTVAAHHLAALLGAGQTDLYCPAFNLGFPMSLYYQPLPHLVPALLHLLSLGLIPVQWAFNLSLVLLYCAYPLAVYRGARWLGLGDAAALCAGALAPLVSSSLGFGFTVHSVMGAGLYTQTYAMVLLPLCLGALWRYLRSGRAGMAAAGLLVLLCLSHAFYGLAAGTAGVVMVAVCPGEARRGTLRLAAVCLAAGASLLFWLLPLLLTRQHMGAWPWGGEERWLGYGAQRVSLELISGRLLDNGRALPIITAALGLGAILAGRRWRREAAGRALLLCIALFTFFLMGRRTFGHLVDIQPANLGLQLFRYLGVVHLFGVLLAGLGLGAALGWASRRLPDMASLLLAAALLASPLLWYGHAGKELFRTVESFEIRQADLRGVARAIAQARRAGAPPGRIYAHTKSGAGTHLVSALLARYTDQPMGQSYGVGMHDSLGFYYLEYLDPEDRDHLARYNFRFILARPGNAAARGLPELYRVGDRLGLYLLPGEYGYFMPLENPTLLRGPPRQERRAARRAVPRQGGGVVLQEQALVNQYRARVRLERAGVVALKVAHHPLWRAEVDGRPVALLRAAPVFLAARVPAGEHEVRFRFSTPWWQKGLLFLAAAAWFVAGLARLRRRRKA